MAAPFPLPGGAPPLVEPLIPPQPLTLSGRAHRTGCSRWVGRPFHRPWSITGVDHRRSRASCTAKGHCRRPSGANKKRWDPPSPTPKLRGPRNTAHRSTPTNCTPDLSQTHVLKPSSGRDSSHRHCQPDVRAVPRCRSVSAGLLAVKAKPLRGGLRPALTAPTPRGIGSYARNREKTGQHLKKPVFKPALHFSRSTVYSRVIRTDTAGGNHGTPLCSR
jgi:hypothetical protein